MYNYIPTGTCAKEINFDIKDNKITNVSFIKGCSGNLTAMGNLLEGMQVEEAVKKLRGINCGSKGTSCADQFAKALEQLVLNK